MCVIYLEVTWSLQTTRVANFEIIIVSANLFFLVFLLRWFFLDYLKCLAILVRVISAFRARVTSRLSSGVWLPRGRSSSEQIVSFAIGEKFPFEKIRFSFAAHLWLRKTQQLIDILVRCGFFL